MPRFDSLSSERFWLIPISLFCLTVPVMAIGSACQEFKIHAFLPLAVYGAYVVGVATLLTMIAQHLYAMHEVRRFVFDIAIWFMLAGLVALPLSVARMEASCFGSAAPNFDSSKLQALTLMLAGIFYLLIVPVFFVTEAAMTLTCIVARSVKHRIIKNRP